MCAARIQRWAILLSSYEYKLQYRPGSSNGNADCMSRLPVDKPNSESTIKTYVMMMELTHAPVKMLDVQKYTRRDPIIAKVADMVLSREKMDSDVSPELVSYIRRIDELVVEDGVLLWGSRVVIPSELRRVVLKEGTS